MGEETNEDYDKLHKEAEALFAALEKSEAKATPLNNLVNQARDIVAGYDHTALLAARLNLVSLHNTPAYFNDLIERLGDITESTVEDISLNLDARLIKQAQSLDAMHDLLLHLSQYALAQDTKSLQSHINLALRAQDQSARTIERFKKLGRKNYVKMAERTEQP